MPRYPRYIPPGSLVEVTTRTIHARFLLRPSRDLTEITLGILARAAKLYDVRVCAFVFLSNHFHLLVIPADAHELARFMSFLNGNLAKEAGRLHRWRDRIWARRYQAIVVSDEEAAQVRRLRYILDNGCKEHLVRRPQDWPGAHSAEALITGCKLRGVWFDRSAEYEARRRGASFGKYEFSEELELELTPIPAWRELAPKEIRRRVHEMAREIESETRKRTRETGRLPMGIRKICQQDPHDAPERSSRSPAPRFHAAQRQVRKALERAHRLFQLAYREAAQQLKEGNPRAEFPPGCFRPALPFAQARLAQARL